MLPALLKITVLGSGTSMGVPTPGCHCRVCKSTDPHDKRLRPSLLLSRGGQNVVIDTTPDFRQQALRAGIDRLDAILLTHAHADHIMGFDDIRPFSLRQNSALPVYSNAPTFQTLRRAFSYVFDDVPKLSSIPSATLLEVSSPFDLLGISFTPIPLVHGNLEVLGYRFGRAAYLTDFSSLPDSSVALLSDLDDLIIDALRDLPHPMHQTVDQALTLIKKLNPRRAWFTHIAHDLSHAETNERLRNLGYPNVQLAYDGLEIELQIDESDSRAASSHHRAADTRSKAAAVHLTPSRTQPAISILSSSAAWAQHYAAPGAGSILAIGNFDGTHLGHQAILAAAVARAHQLQAVPTVLTFDPLPPKVLRPESAPPRLSTNEQRIGRFAAVGMEAAVVLPFTQELSRLAPQEFVDQILVHDLRVRAVFVGENFRFGHRQAGDSQLLLQLGVAHGFEVFILPPVHVHGEIVSSTLIRRQIALGNVTRAGRLLGRPFVLSGKVVPGTGTGRRFTFPTLNLSPDQELLPARGVYFTRTLFPGESRSRPSVTNIGLRPTFNGSSLTVETHVLEAVGGERSAAPFGSKGVVLSSTQANSQPRNANSPGNADLPIGILQPTPLPSTDSSGAFPSPSYIEVEFWKRLREEKKFNSPDELRTQIARDIARAQSFFRRLCAFRSSRQPA